MSASTTVTTTTTPDIIKKLQNGSDVRGVALTGVEGEPVTLNDEAAYLIGAAFVDWLAEKKGKKPEELTVGVGRDPRQGLSLAHKQLSFVIFTSHEARSTARVSI